MGSSDSKRRKSEVDLVAARLVDAAVKKAFILSRGEKGIIYNTRYGVKTRASRAVDTTLLRRMHMQPALSREAPPLGVPVFVMSCSWFRREGKRLVYPMSSILGILRTLSSS